MCSSLTNLQQKYLYIYRTSSILCKMKHHDINLSYFNAKLFQIIILLTITVMVTLPVLNIWAKLEQ